jgi:hypothetical protein
MMENSREEAQAIVNYIRENRGGLTDDDRQATRPSVIRIIGYMQNTIAASARVLATELYSTDTRFVFELIQNAEDNSYDRALDRQVTPFLKFTLFRDRILVDSNEDGFKKEDVEAICDIGRSKKTVARGYIGHKGIGFKSVFRIASKVSIQSGPFSFYFQHVPGENGIGMVTPVNRDYETLPDGVTTRLTLHLTHIEDFASRARDFEMIPDALILFLSKLGKISVLIFPEEGPTSLVSYERQMNEQNPLVKVVKASIDHVENSYYHVENRVVSNLPQDESRPGLTEVEVVLAFPLNADSQPEIHSQYVYSFLPLGLQKEFNVRDFG